MTVNVERHADGAVAQQLADDLRMHPLLQEQCRAGMPQIMESAPWNPGLGQHAPEVPAQQIARIEWLANFISEALVPFDGSPPRAILLAVTAVESHAPPQSNILVIRGRL